MMTTRMRSVLQALRALGPYVLIELVLPGGTLFALVLWLAQQRRAAASRLRSTVPPHAVEAMGMKG